MAKKKAARKAARKKTSRKKTPTRSKTRTSKPTKVDTPDSPPKEELSQKEREQLFEAYIERSKKEFMMYVRGLTIKSGYGPQPFHECATDFQIKVLEDIAPSLEAEQRGEMPLVRRVWLERTKKASKDTDLGSILSWFVAFPTRPMFLQVGAADRDQAGIVKRRINDILYYNPWLNDFIEVKSYEILSKSGLAQIEIVAADIAGSHGETPDVLVLNELSHVTKWEFIQNLMDNAAGVPQGMILAATNAGIIGTKAHKLREQAKESKNWYFHTFQEPAPWLTQEDLEEAKQSNSPSRYKRLFKGVWSSGKGDALDENDIDRCFARGNKIGPIYEPNPDHVYVAGLDLGVSHDHSGAVILGVHREAQKVQLAQMKSWKPSVRMYDKLEVDLQAVEDWCFSMWKVFRVVWFGYDPTQAKLMAQRLMRRGVPMREFTFASGPNLTDMAVSMIQSIEDGTLDCFDDEEGSLRRDFGKFNIVERLMGGRVDKDTGEKPASYKLVAVSDEFGHADVGTALAIALPRAMKILEMSFFDPNEVLATPEDDENDMSEDEVEVMDPELKAIYEVYDRGL